MLTMERADIPEFRAWDSISEEVLGMEARATTDYEKALVRLVRDFNHIGAMTSSAEDAARKRQEMLAPFGVGLGPDTARRYLSVVGEILADYFDRGVKVAEDYRREHGVLRDTPELQEVPS